MLDIKQIVCPIDFSDFSRRALDYAIALASRYSARVTAVHVHPIGVHSAAWAPDGTGLIEPIVLSTEDRDLLTRKLTDFVCAEHAGRLPIDIRVAEGTVWREIVTLADETSADLLVVGTHGHSGFERLLLGSVTEKILRSAPCSVLTVPGATPDAAHIAPGLFERILCPTDFSPESDRAVRWAASLAQEADAELLLLHVLEEPIATGFEGFPRSGLAEYRREYEESCVRRLRQAVPEAARTYCTVKQAISVGKVPQEILHVASDQGSHLIVMGVGGHRSIGDRVFGSTTQHVIRGATCPVLTLRASGRSRISKPKTVVAMSHGVLGYR